MRPAGTELPGARTSAGQPHAEWLLHEEGGWDPFKLAVGLHGWSIVFRTLFFSTKMASQLSRGTSSSFCNHIVIWKPGEQHPRSPCITLIPACTPTSACRTTRAMARMPCTSVTSTLRWSSGLSPTPSERGISDLHCLILLHHFATLEYPLAV